MNEGALGNPPPLCAGQAGLLHTLSNSYRLHAAPSTPTYTISMQKDTFEETSLDQGREALAVHTGPCLLRTEELAGTELAWLTPPCRCRGFCDSLGQGRPNRMAGDGWHQAYQHSHNLSSFPRHSTFQERSIVTE